MKAEVFTAYFQRLIMTPFARGCVKTSIEIYYLCCSNSRFS